MAQLINSGKYAAELRQGDSILVAIDGRGKHPSYAFIATVESVALDSPGQWCIEYSYRSEGYGTLHGYKIYSGQETVDTVILDAHPSEH